MAKQFQAAVGGEDVIESTLIFVQETDLRTKINGIECFTLFVR